MAESLDPEDCIHGWKAIASFFGRSPRAVQRWEAELGLPVRRIKTEKGQTVFALKSELTAWLGVNHSKLDEPEIPIPTVPQASRAHTRTSRFLITAGIIAVLIGAAIPWIPRIGGSAGRKVERIDIRGRYLEAFGSSGELVWAFDLGKEGGRLVSSRDSLYRPNPLLSDLDRDGTKEVIVAMHFGTNERDLGEGHQLLCFSARGELRWTYLPNLKFDFPDQTFDGASRFLAWMPDGQGAIWVSVNHNTWWPTAIVRVDHRGHSEIRYIHSGGIYAMTKWSVGNTTYLALGGINNEYRKAALTLLDIDSAPAASPQSPGSQFLCSGCSSARPTAFYLFERTDLNESSGEPYARVGSTTVVGDRLKVMTEEERNVAVVHFVDSTLAVTGSMLNDAFAGVHDDATAQGRLDHLAADCPARDRVKHVDIWRPTTGWSSQGFRTK